MPVKIADWEQLDEEQLLNLPGEQQVALACKLVEELKQARAQLKAASPSGSGQPNSDPPRSGVENRGGKSH